MDILERHLKAYSITPLRIDGRVRDIDRLSILNRFKEPQARVLLMSIQTGAFG